MKRSGTARVNGELVRRIRIENGWDLAEMADRAECGVRTIQKLEAGKSAKLATIKAIANACGMRTQDFLVDHQPDSQQPLTIAWITESFAFFDLRQWAAPTQQGSEVTLYARHVYRSIPPRQPYLTFPYATQGSGLRGRSLNWSNFDFVDITDPASPIEDRHLARQAEIRIGLTDGEYSLPLLVENEVVYINAFKNVTEEFIHNHIEEPTDTVTTIVEFPASKPCIDAWGLWRNGNIASFQRHPQQPLRSPDGHLVYWQVRDAQPPEIYQIRWHW